MAAIAPPKVITTADLDDLRELVELENKVFTYDRILQQEFADLIKDDNADVIITREAGIISGYGIMKYDRFAYLYSLVSIAHTGEQILKYLEALAENRRKTRVYLEVKTDNLAAIRLYKKSGYVLHNKIEGFYEDKSTALRFCKVLKS